MNKDKDIGIGKDLRQKPVLHCFLRNFAHNVQF